MKSETVYTKLQRIAEQAAKFPERVFTTLVHLIDEEFLKEAYRKTRKDAAPGIDGMTAKEYGINLDNKINDLLKRMKTGKYRATPVRKVSISKDDGGMRELGICQFEDKVVQKAVSMILSAIYEQDFYEMSYGFRPERSAHQGLSYLRSNCMRKNINWILDIDICGFFDNLDRKHLREIMKLRVNDGGIIRLIGKWFNAGILDGKNLRYTTKGAIQGGTVSPILSNIYLHTVLDKWYMEQIRLQLSSDSVAVRFADDVVFGCKTKVQAQWLLEQVKTRFAAYGLEVHPEKTKIVKFSDPERDVDDSENNGTFDFLGFTHYWAKSQKGYWVIKRKTSNKKLRKSLRNNWCWIKSNRHESVKWQHQKLCQKLRGYYQYYGIRCNYCSLYRVYREVKKAWRYWLNRRGGKRINWTKFEEIWKIFPLPRPRIVHNI
jgi:group II intron reverse transcriptase/maturase